MMSGIRSSNTKPEILVRKALHRLGYRFRLNSKIGKIKPDIVLPKYKVAIFVHGCYWHQHDGCKLAYADKKYSDKWKKKFSDNRERDKRITEQLLEQGWRVAVIWECTTRDVSVLDKEVSKLHRWIKSGKARYYESVFIKI